MTPVDGLRHRHSLYNGVDFRWPKTATTVWDRPLGGSGLSELNGDGTSSHHGARRSVRVPVRCIPVTIFLTMATLIGAEAPDYILETIRSHTTPDVLRAFV